MGGLLYTMPDSSRMQRAFLAQRRKGRKYAVWMMLVIPNVAVIGH